MTSQNANEGQLSRAETFRLQSEPTIAERLTCKAVNLGESLGAGGAQSGTLSRIEGLLGSVT